MKNVQPEPGPFGTTFSKSKSFFSLLLLAFEALSFAHCFPAGEKAEVPKIIQAYGGKDALARVSSLAAKGKITTFMPKDDGIYFLSLKRKQEIARGHQIHEKDGKEDIEWGPGIQRKRKDVPQDMDMSDESYKKRLKKVYEDHPGDITFENFCQSQILWDETMAHSAARFLEEHPDYQLVVLAGVEHIMYGSGIPSRIHRLTGRDYVTLINGPFDRDIGTYVLFPKPLKLPFIARLGVIVKEANGVVLVNDFSSDSLALKAGLKEGDIIASVNGWKIEAVSDIKIALFDKEPGQTVSVKVVRKRFLFGARELEFHISL